jgi:hypothetical protein
VLESSRRRALDARSHFAMDADLAKVIQCRQCAATDPAVGQVQEQDLWAAQVAQMQEDFDALHAEFASLSVQHGERIGELERQIAEETHAANAAEAQTLRLDDEVEYHMARTKMLARYWQATDQRQNEGISLYRLRLEEFSIPSGVSQVAAELENLVREHEASAKAYDEGAREARAMERSALIMEVAFVESQSCCSTGIFHG